MALSRFSDRAWSALFLPLLPQVHQNAKTGIDDLFPSRVFAAGLGPRDAGDGYGLEFRNRARRRVANVKQPTIRDRHWRFYRHRVGTGEVLRPRGFRRFDRGG